ncbi:hypothetical protein [Orientia tsutsugamushi]|uniref:hypothetical protein n=1 Tax=Orientia tsutsugamushi TaxID=784 RepID=UPI003529CCA3
MANYISCSFMNRPLSKLVKVVQNYNKLNLRENLLRLFRYLSAIILNYFNQFRKKSIISCMPFILCFSYFLLS